MLNICTADTVWPACGYLSTPASWFGGSLVREAYFSACPPKAIFPHSYCRDNQTETGRGSYVYAMASGKTP